MNNQFSMPQSIYEQLDKLNKLVTENPVSISVPEVAAFLQMKPEGIRSALERGTCPFGFSWQLTPYSLKSYKIPTVTFYLWYTQSVGLRNIC